LRHLQRKTPEASKWEYNEYMLHPPTTQDITVIGTVPKVSCTALAR